VEFPGLPEKISLDIADFRDILRCGNIHSYQSLRGNIHVFIEKKLSFSAHFFTKLSTSLSHSAFQMNAEIESFCGVRKRREVRFHRCMVITAYYVYYIYIYDKKLI
jgi:hypothetical protein